MFIYIDRLGFSPSSDDDKYFVASDLSSSQESEVAGKNI
jgi:hypothetical protein